MTGSSRTLRQIRILDRCMGAGALMLALAACTDAGAPVNAQRGSATLGVTASIVSAAPAALQIDAARVDVSVTRSDETVVADTTVVLSSGQKQVTLTLQLEEVSESDQLDVSVRVLEASGIVLYHGDLSGITPDGTPVNVGLTYSGPASVAVTPTSLSLANLGATAPLTATVRDPSGAPISGAAVTWRSTNALIATVSAAGVVTGVAPGSTTISATAYGLSSPLVAVSVANRFAWLGGNGRWHDTTKWAGGRVPRGGADVDITADGNYTVTGLGDSYADIAVLRVGKAGNTGRQTLLMNPGDSLSGVVLEAQSVVVGPSGVIDATAWEMDIQQLVNDGLVELRQGTLVGGAYQGTAASELRLNGSRVDFTDTWPGSQPRPSAGGPVSNAGRIVGPGTIDVSRRTRFDNSGTLRPGGLLQVSGALAMLAGSTLESRISGTTPATGFDVLAVSGPVSLVGARLSLLPTFFPATGNGFSILTASALGGSFQSVAGAALSNGRTLTLQYGQFGVTLLCCTP